VTHLADENKTFTLRIAQISAPCYIQWYR